MSINKNNVALLVRKKESHFYSRLTDTSKAYSVLQAYPMLHFYGGEGLLHEKQVCQYAPYDKQFVWVDEMEKTTHILNPGKTLDLKYIKVFDLLSLVQKHQIKQLIELGWIKNMYWLNNDVDFSMDLVSQTYKKNDSYMWYVVEYFINKILENKKYNVWYEHKAYKGSGTSADLNLDEDIKDLIANVLAKNPEFLVFPVEYKQNNWKIIEYHSSDGTDFMLYKNLLYSQIDMTEEDKELWWNYFEKMAWAKDISSQSIYGKVSDAAIKQATSSFKSINEMYTIDKLKWLNYNPDLISSIKKERLL